MSRSRPINTRPWRKPPWRRRRRSGFWFIPPVSDGSDDARFSCWADNDLAMVATDSGSSLPKLLICPIVWNVQESFPPGVMGAFDNQFKAHPLAERWKIDRIVGDVMIQASHVTGVNDPGVGGPMLVNFSFQDTGTISDSPVVFSPALNDSALGRRRIHERRVFISPDFVGCHTCDTEDENGGKTGTTGSTIAAAQRFGVPTAKVVHFDLRPRAVVKPEMTLSMIVTCSSAAPDNETLFILPKLKAWVSKSG